MRFPLVFCALWAACGGTPSPESALKRALLADDATLDSEGVIHWSDTETPVGFTVQDTPCRIVLKSHGWAGLDEAAGTGGVARLLTEIAARNAESPGVRIGLDASSGDVEVDVTLWCEGGLPEQAALDAVRTLHAAVRDMRTPLRKAATLAPL